jgi:hypothetical protein
MSSLPTHSTELRSWGQLLSCQALEFLHNKTNKKVRIPVSNLKLHLFLIYDLCLGNLLRQSMLELILTYLGRQNPWEQGCHISGEWRERCEVQHPEIWPEGGSEVSTNILLRWSPCPCCPHWCSIVSMASLHHSYWLPHRASSGRCHKQQPQTLLASPKLQAESGKLQLPAEASCY